MSPDFRSYHKHGRIKIKALPSMQAIRDKFDYDIASGRLVHKGLKRTMTKSYFKCFGTQFYHYRLVWGWHYGDPGPYVIDHIDGDRQNDRIENLRIATQAQNAANRHAKGYRRMASGRYQVRCVKDGVEHYGRVCHTEDEASAAAIELRVALHGSFAPRPKLIAGNASATRGKRKRPLDGQTSFLQ